MKVSTIDAQFYGERKLKLQRRVSVHSCINQRAADSKRRHYVDNTVTLLLMVRKREGERGMIEMVRQYQNSSDKVRAAMCKKWYRRIIQNRIAAW